MLSTLAIFSLGLDASSFVEGDTITLFCFPQRPNDCLKKVMILIPDEHKDLSSNLKLQCIKQRGFSVVDYPLSAAILITKFIQILTGVCPGRPSTGVRRLVLWSDLLSISVTEDLVI